MKDEKKLELINVGVVGHIDHGKTTLVEKLTGQWASRHSEELKRGITIKLGYADVVIYKKGSEYNISGEGEPMRHVSFVDAPGHEMLMATMLSGAAMIDAAILVVAANEGIKPQTREHLMALQAKGIKRLIVVQNKIDLIDKKRAEESYKEIKELLKGKYDNAEVIPTSAQQGVNVSEVLRAISELDIPERDTKSEPVFIVARSFDINRPGTNPEKLHGAVLGGTLKRGTLNVGDKIEIKPGRVVKEANQYRHEALKTKVLGLFVGREKVDSLEPGGSASIETELDMSLGKSDSLAGNVVSSEGKLPDATTSLKIKFKLFPEIFGIGGHNKVENIKPSELLMISANTSISGGAVKHVRGDNFDINLQVPIIVFKGDTIGIARNINGHWRLIGSGEIC